MVQHGSYRPDGGGVQTFQIHPSGWHFAEGHVAKLELLGRDAPYAQPSNGTFSITTQEVVFELPVREPPDGRLIEPCAPAALELTLVVAKRQRALTAKRLRFRAGCPREPCTVRARLGRAAPAGTAPPAAWGAPGSWSPEARRRSRYGSRRRSAARYGGPWPAVARAGSRSP